ncbi:lysine transporter LysE [Streptomyces sp. NPDC002773]|uniref:lysine transporter LysE n=1 Tax=Streptomyces sp. NPDC002773 TaxID=3154430 RepID=UPI003319F30A
MRVVRKAAKGIKEFLLETVGEVVAELILTALACALLAGLSLLAYLSWSFSPRLTLAGAALFGLFLAHGAWATFRDPTKARGRRRLAAASTAGFSLTACTAVFLLLYGTD